MANIALYPEMIFKDLNQQLWFRKTVESTEVYCNDFLSLLDGDFKVDSDELLKYLYKIVHLENVKRLHEIKEEDFLKVFPKEVMGHIHEYPTTIDPHPADRACFEPKHLMYKYAIIRDNENRITYEFLIEYGLLESDVEIYYGIKAISDFWNQDEKSQQTAENFLSEAEKFYNTIIDPILRDNRHNKNSRRFKVTNNVSDGTYWLFWIRIESEDKISDALKKLEDFYKALSKKYEYKKGVDEKKKHAHRSLAVLPVFFVRNSAYSRLLYWIRKTYKEAGAQNNYDFESFIDSLTRQPVKGNKTVFILSKLWYGKYKFNVSDASIRIILLWFFDRDYMKWLTNKGIHKDTLKDILKFNGELKSLPWQLHDVFLNMKNVPIEIPRRDSLPKSEAKNLSEKEDHADYWEKTLKNLIPAEFRTQTT